MKFVVVNFKKKARAGHRHNLEEMIAREGGPLAAARGIDRCRHW